jgi:hypothetical protein
MFAKTFIAALLTATLASARPGQPQWPETTCSTLYSTSYYTIETKVPVVESKTIWVPSTTTIEGSATSVSLVTKVKPVTTGKPTCITTSYAVQVWVTKEISTWVPVTINETCTESSTVVVPTCTTSVTSVAKVESCTEYTTSCITTSSVCSTTTCKPCEGSAGLTWAAGPTAPPAAGVTWKPAARRL